MSVDAVVADWHWDALLRDSRSLLDAQPDELSLIGRLDLLAEIQRERSRLAALEAQALLAIVGSEPHRRDVAVVASAAIVIEDEAVDLVAAALHRSPITVGRQVADARLLCAGLPRIWDALDAGVLSVEQAASIVRHAHDLQGSALAAYESRLLAKAADLTPTETASLARRVRARVDAQGEEARRQNAARHVDIRIWAEDDGLACLMARLPVADAARLHAAIESRARQVVAPCDASIGERRVAGLLDALCGGAAQSSARVGIEVQVTVDVVTLMGMGDAPALVSLGSGPQEPITAAALLELLANDDAELTLRRLVTDSTTGALLDRGRSVYRVPDSLRDFIVARDGTCRFPGCRRAAAGCEIDHAVAWDSGGSTDRSNLGPLCRRHHLLKTHAGWAITRTRDDGTTDWRGPDGRHYVFHPFRVEPEQPAAEPDLPPPTPPSRPPF